VPPPLPEHLFEQADRLTTAVDTRQTDLRRAISNAYYGLFHFALTAAADMVVGAAEQATPRYVLVYRSVDHTRLRALCVQIRATNPQNVPLVPVDGFGSIADFARITFNLYELRILADYDPARWFTLDEARLAVSDAREAIKMFQQGSEEQQQAFLTLLLFKQR
jgi:uncharacterized protein (UPF0332 family)